MEDLPAERYQIGTRPFTTVCLDLLGPFIVKLMVNKRGKPMKVWPMFFCCQASGAIHCQLMANYGTDAFLTQWNQFTGIYGDPAVAVSDCGSQLTWANNKVAFPDSEAPIN